MTAINALLTAGISAFPTDLREIARCYNIKLTDYSFISQVYDISKEELYRTVSAYGFSFMDEGRYACAINKNACGNQRRRWTLAHEIAHILLGHVNDITAENIGASLGTEYERQADAFAAELLAPLSLLQFCGVSSAEEIAWLCGLSNQAAEYRFQELCRLRRQHSAIQSCKKRNPQHEEQSAFLRSDEEKALFMQFMPFIAEYLSQRSCHDGYREYAKRRLANPMHIE